MDSKQQKPRRKALLVLTGGVIGASQLPKAWTRPVVNSIVLPTHAQTTTPEIQSQPDETPVKPTLPTHFRSDISFNVVITENSQPASDILSLLIPDAQAGVKNTPELSGDLMIDSPDGINFTAKCNLFVYQSIVTLTASGQVNGAAVSLIASACGNAPIGTISVTTITANGAPYSINLQSFFSGSNSQGVLPVGLDEPATSNDCPFDA